MTCVVIAVSCFTGLVEFWIRMSGNLPPIERNSIIKG